MELILMYRIHRGVCRSPAQLLMCFISLLTIAAVLMASMADGTVVDGQPCHREKRTTIGRCSMHCVCRSGRWRCCRLRKDFTEMPVHEANRFTSALVRARTNTRLARFYRELAIKHVQLGDRVHKWPYLFPFHRYWVLRLETALREVVDCHITVPYYNHTRHWRDWWAHSPFSSLYLGGNGKGPNCCVKTGPFREGKWTVTGVRQSGCLKRFFNKKAVMVSHRVLSILIGLFKADQFKMVSDVLNHWVHSKLHDAVGGYFYSFEAMNDPTFFVLHSFLDKVWSIWQQRGPQFRRYPYGYMADVAMPGTPNGVHYTLADFHDLDNLPGNVRICYSEGKDLTKADVSGDAVGPATMHSLQRNDDPQQLKEIMTNLDKDELGQLGTMFGLLSGKVTADGLDRLPGDCVK